MVRQEVGHFGTYTGLVKDELMRAEVILSLNANSRVFTRLLKKSHQICVCAHAMRNERYMPSFLWMQRKLDAEKA
ncbi:hypothetical protein Krac_1532 [Ktedonobacter racemifer DSM 44963]|uniref:Uncharacterized protein n=1 Tax=Ktedonobacter racemifer DSM 44963 TaxID=485913 RepID=D6U215_KTERA|nr:hypothetical protein Krac_1532 [Ktedonobacter racemifer DSM 44963]